MQLHDYAKVAPRDIFPGFRGRYIHSAQVTQGRIDAAAGATVPVHQHIHEQWTTVISGTFELIVGGVTHTLTAGQTIYLAPNEPHGARAVTACEILDVFQPPRDDYR